MKELINIKFSLVKQLTNNAIGYSVINYNALRGIVKFTERTIDETDPFADELEVQKEKERKERYYQRLRESNKVNSIKSFIVKEIVKKYKYEQKKSMLSPLGAFPTSILLAVNLSDTDTLEEYQKEDYNGLSFLDNDILYIPKGESILIVDGQHRIEGLNLLRNDIIENKVRYNKKFIHEEFGYKIYDYLLNEIDLFEFACMLLIDFDLYEQGEIFANTNFNQKPVNKSIYFDIFGTSPNTEKNSLKLAHDIVSHLNYSEKSPLYKKIKMLGSGDGLISQAALVELFMELFSPKKVWGFLYSDYLNNGQEYKYVTIFIRAYLKAFEIVFNKYWPKEGENTSRTYHNILCKTTGLGALIKLIQHFYKFTKEFEKDIPSIMKEEEVITKKVAEKLREVEDKGAKYFSGIEGEGDFAKGGSKGFQNKLYKDIAQDLGFIKIPKPGGEKFN